MTRRTVSILASLLCTALAYAKPRLVPIPNYAYTTPQSSNPNSFTPLGSQVLFIANDVVHGAEVWRTDGTLAGTMMIRDIAPGNVSSQPKIAGVANGAVIFTALENPSTSSILSLWRTDGTSAGTTKLADLPNGIYPSGQVVIAGTRVYALIGEYSSPRSLWSYDLNNGTTTQLNIPIVSSSPVIIAAGNAVYFAGAIDQSIGVQLWTSDGTAQGTHIVRRGLECPGLSCGPVPVSFFKIGERLCIITSTEVWTTDGTPAGTLRLATMRPAAVPMPQLVATSSTVAYFQSGSDLWRTDGTPSGTTVVGAIPATTFIWYGTVLADDKLLFIMTSSANSPQQYELWKTGDSPAAKLSTLPFIPTTGYDWINAGFAFPYGTVGTIGGKILLPGAPNQGGDSELWSVDPVTGDASLVKQIETRQNSISTPSFNAHPGVGFPIGGRIIFPASDIAGRELWETDGTTAGTRLFDNIAPDTGGGSVSGTVRDRATNAPIVNATVLLCANFRCQSPDVAITAADGTYRFDSITPGSGYEVFAHAASYVSQGFSGMDCGDCPVVDSLDGSSGNNVSIAAGMQTTSVDFALTSGGTITVREHVRSTGQPVKGFLVLIIGTNGQLMQRLSVSPSVTSATSALLAPGTYYVQTQYSALADQVYNGHDCASTCDPTVGDPVTVTSGNDTPIEFALSDLGRISGTVHESPSGLPVGGVTVYFRMILNNIVYGGSATTDGNGHYTSSPLQAGNWYVEIPDSGGPLTGVLYPNGPCNSPYMCDTTGGTAIPVSPNTTVSGIDMTMNRASGWGRIGGTILDRDGAPFSRLPVTFSANGFSYPEYTAYTDANGIYNAFVPPGTYTMVAANEAYPGGIDCNFNTCDVSNAQHMTIADGQSLTVNMQVQSKRTTITGRVSDSLTSTGLDADLILYNQAGQSLATQGTSSSADNGTYSFDWIGKDANVFVRAAALPYRPAGYGDVLWPCLNTSNCVPPAGVTALAAGDHSSVDIHLSRYATIKGTVTDTTGQPLSSINLYFQDVSTGGITAVHTDSLGHYLMNTAEGSYYVTADNNPTYQRQIYRDVNCASACDLSQGVVVTATGSTTVNGIDFHLQSLPAGGTITGAVLDDLTGAPVSNVIVSILDLPNVYTYTDATGHYTFNNLASGSYRLAANGPKPFFYAIRGGANCVDAASCDGNSAVRVQVTYPDTTSGVDFRLIRLHVAAIDPASGSTSGGTQVRITGVNFTPQASVMIGSRNATVLSRSASELIVATPSVTAGGAVNVTVTDSPSLFVVLAQAFTYIEPPFLIAAHGLPSGISVVTSLPSGTSSATLYRRPSGSSDWTAIAGWSPASPTDATNPSRGILYEYHVEAIVNGSLEISNMSTAMLFTDDPVMAGTTTVKRAHFAELVIAINAVRRTAGLPDIAFDPAPGSAVRAQDLNQLRTGILQAWTARGLGAPTFSDPLVTAQMPIKAVHIQELRELLR